MAYVKGSWKADDGSEKGGFNYQHLFHRRSRTGRSTRSFGIFCIKSGSEPPHKGLFRALSLVLVILNSSLKEMNMCGSSS